MTDIYDKYSRNLSVIQDSTSFPTSKMLCSGVWE